MAEAVPQGNARDFTLFMGCQRATEKNCGYWAVAQLLTLQETSMTPALVTNTPEAVVDALSVCPTKALIKVSQWTEAIMARHPPKILAAVPMEEGRVFCSDVAHLGNKTGLKQAAIVCETPWHCTRFGCMATPPRLQGIQNWVVLAGGHWFAAVTKASKSGAVLKVTAIDSLRAAYAKDFDRCAALRAILRRTYSKGVLK